MPGRARFSRHGTRRPALRLLVVVAHPDDETFGCGSLVLHAREAGAEVHVLCATRGEAGEVAPGVTLPEQGLGALREAELREAGRILGVEEVRTLTYLDSGMDGEPAAGTLCSAPLSLLEEDVSDVVACLLPDALVTLDGSDGHRDHLAVREATERVAATFRLPLYLHCLPRSVMSRWADHTATVDPGSAYLRGLELGTPDEQVTYRLDTAVHLERRWRAIRAHRSQTSPFEGLPEDLQRAFLAQDHLIEVLPEGAEQPVGLLGQPR
ncbi:PIG-L family deacetylase [Nocardioides sp. HDW12B]|uniref:PIG-L deacetylase family protein n=1 Tax=Nocardioides sp. HDW12B TaxID=2714939 RepID=UPI001407D57D|nr:PIG-L deacetylase family protein [Nocardioides sp. HDW12B]QIK68033.1 PIG-L family deacetylase [Nocardioides sp. HDW12B]